MDVRFLSDADASATMLKLIASCDQSSFAVAWAGRNRVADGLRKHAAKVKHGVIGTHMYQTSPDVLRDFIGSRSVRYMRPNGRLFHPKAYVFWHGNTITAIVGSHNLTASAFEGHNVEASLMYSGKSTEPALRDIASFIEQSWAEAHRIEDDDFLFSYELQYKANQSKRQALERFHLAKRPKRKQASSPLALTWKAFIDGVRRDKHHSEMGRIAILERARALFAVRGSFGRMNQHERKAIAGTYGRKEPQLDGHDWAWFGTMFGQGDFKNLVNRSPALLSNALDRIPLSGDLTEAQYNQFAADFRMAFAGKAHKGGVATASRLLALKRPDWFVAVNNANRGSLCAALAVAPSTLSLDNYWNSIVVPITMSDWWNHPRPTTRAEARIWDNRAALLDSLFYEPI